MSWLKFVWWRKTFKKLIWTFLLTLTYYKLDLQEGRPRLVDSVIDLIQLGYWMYTRNKRFLLCG